MALSYDPEMPCLGIHAKEMKSGSCEISELTGSLSIFHNRQDMEATKVSMDRRMGEENITHTNTHTHTHTPGLCVYKMLIDIILPCSGVIFWVYALS